MRMNIKDGYKLFRDTFPLFKLAHRFYEKRCRKEYRGSDDISILASNCIGGEIYHDLGLPFNSPTINFWMHQNDFLKFVKDLNFYLTEKLIFVDEEERRWHYPVATLGGDKRKVTLYFLHYKNRKDAEQKWEERKQRINYDKLCLIMCDRDGITYDDIVAFGKIPCYRRVMFTYKDYPEFSYTSRMPQDGNKECVINYQMKKWNGFWKWEDRFNCSQWLNGNDFKGTEN